MEYKVEDFTNEKMGMICSWFQHIVNMACKLTTGNVAHQGATIRNYARSYIEYITDFYINDDWHPYDRQDHSTASPNNEVVLTHLETGGVVAQRYSECYGRFDINNLVDKYKYVRLKKKMIEFGFTPCPYHVINCKVKIPKPYKPRNLHDKKRHDMYMRKLLNRKSKMTIKVDYSQSMIDNKDPYIHMEYPIRAIAIIVMSIVIGMIGMQIKY